MIPLTSRANPKIKHIEKLIKDREYRYEHAEYVSEGFNAIPDISRAKEIFVRIGTDIPRLASSPHSLVSKELFNKIAGTQNSQGIIAILPFKIYNLSDIKNDSRYVLLDRIQDPGNMGTIIRTAQAFGIGQIIVTSGCVDPYSPKVVRASAGTIDRTKIFAVTDIKELAPFTVIAADKKGTNISSFHWPRSFILAIGNEAQGLSPAVQSIMHNTVSIPMVKEVESLNAAIAAGIILFSALKENVNGK